jgi:hypothetical protein
VAMIVVLFPASDREPRLEPVALEALARLGVTSAALVRDSSVTGLVLEGWTFDPRDAALAARAVAGAGGAIRTLQPLAHMGISSAVALRGDGKE